MNSWMYLVLLSLLVIILNKLRKRESSVETLSGEEDEVINGTSWRYVEDAEGPAPTKPDKECVKDKPLSIHDFLKKYKQVKFKTLNVFIQKLEDDVASREDRQLWFYYGMCWYTDERHVLRVKNYYDDTWLTYKLKPGMYELDGRRMEVCADGLYWLGEKDDERELYIALENYEVKSCIEHKFVKEKVLENTAIGLSFNRDRSTVLMQNEQMKWVGIVDEDKWQMKVVQFNPERKDIGTFRLV